MRGDRIDDQCGHPAVWLRFAFLGVLIVTGSPLTCPALRADEKKVAADSDLRETAKADSTKQPYKTVTLRGRVVWLADALERRWGIGTVTEAKERTLALETDDGKLLVLVEDLRGRAFRADPRLRKMHVEIQARQYDSTSLIQIVHLFELAKGKKYAVDYWCDICSIAHFELKVCACCQGPLELRRRPVAAAKK